MPLLRVECLQTCNLTGGVLKSQCFASRCKSLILSKYPTSKTNVRLLYFCFFEQPGLHTDAGTADYSEISVKWITTTLSTYKLYWRHGRAQQEVIDAVEMDETHQFCIPINPNCCL
jgi:hypothetical protein